MNVTKAFNHNPALRHYAAWEEKVFPEIVEHLRSLALYDDSQEFTMDSALEGDNTLLVEIGSNGTAYVHGIGGILPVPDACQPYRED